MSAAGTNRHRITDPPKHGSDAQARWSPSGRRIVFARDWANRPYDLAMVARGGGKIRWLTRTRSINERSPAWRPHHREIAFVRSTPKSSDKEAIWLMNVNDRSMTRLTKPAAETDDPSWAPGGHRIAFSKAPGKEPDIYIVTRSGKQKQITSTRGETEYGVDWSPDGEHLAYTYYANAGEVSYVRILNLATGRHRDIGPRASLGGGNSWPVWSSNGKRLLFFRRMESVRKSGLWVMRADGTHAHRLGPSAFPTDWR
jgi:TolB protein